MAPSHLFSLSSHAEKIKKEGGVLRRDTYQRGRGPPHLGPHGREAGARAYQWLVTVRGQAGQREQEHTQRESGAAAAA